MLEFAGFRQVYGDRVVSLPAMMFSSWVVCGSSADGSVTVLGSLGGSVFRVVEFSDVSTGSTVPDSWFDGKPYHVLTSRAKSLGVSPTCGSSVVIDSWVSFLGV